MSIQHLFPKIHADYVPETYKRKQPKQHKGCPQQKYDYVTICTQRLSGVPWQAIAREHGFKSANYARTLTECSSIGRGLSPDNSAVVFNTD